MNSTVYVRRYRFVLLLFLSFIAIAIAAGQDAGSESCELKSLSAQLKAVLEDGCLPASLDLSESERSRLIDARYGMQEGFRKWNEYCISYNDKLDDVFEYRRLKIVQALNEQPLDIPWQIDEWVKTLVDSNDPFRIALSLLTQFPHVSGAVKPITEPCVGGSGRAFDDFRKTFVGAAEIVDQKALVEVSGDERKLLRFVLPWICYAPGQFVSRSKGSPYYGFFHHFDPSDRFPQGAERTVKGGFVVPPALDSMTGVYLYLRALSGQPARKYGFLPDLSPSYAGLIFTNRVDFDSMGDAFALVAGVLSKERLDSLMTEFSEMAPPTNAFVVQGVTGGLLHVEETPYGRIIVGDRGDNQYVDVDAAVILDLGGNDTYVFDRPEHSIGEFPVRIIVDFQGDDVYQASGVGGPAAGILGISILIDRAGDDRYCQGLSEKFKPRNHARGDLVQDDPEGTGTPLVPFAQIYGDPARPDAKGVSLDHGFAYGAGFLGIGLLIDEAGDDLYLGQKYVFGAGYWHGIGILHDSRGNDVYAAGIASIGVGVNGGIGFLVDGDGDDHYQCLGLHEAGASVGREWDNGYDSGGIGYGTSWRGEARGNELDYQKRFTFCGGVGVVYDGGGNDAYISGRMSLAMGYAGGVGIIVDDAGDDVYFARRGPKGENHSGQSGNYSIGHGCHRGIGCLLDRDGNDRYGGCSFGWSWDIACGFLLDLGGDDLYADFYDKRAMGRIGLGMAQGLGVSWNHGGRDVYHCNSFGSAANIATNYPGVGGNFSFFFDVGPELDEYPKAFSNDSAQLVGVVFKEEPDDGAFPQGIGLFMDGESRNLPRRSDNGDFRK